MNEPQLTVQTGEMKRVKCNGVGDNNGFYEMEVKITKNEPPTNQLLKSEKLVSNEPQLSLCPNCYCMTKTIDGK